MPTVDTAAALEQLLKRFEALRGCGLIKVLAVDTAASDMLSQELPLAYGEFSASRRWLATRYGKPHRDRHPAMCFRLLGEPDDIARFMGAAEAAGKQLKGALSQAHLVKAKDLQGANGKAEQAAWLISLFAAAAGKRLPTDGLAGGDWFLWHRQSDIVVAAGTVARHREPRPAAAAALAAVEELAKSAEEPAAFAVLGDAVEISIALLEWLLARRGVDIETTAKAVHRNTCQLLEELCSTQGGLLPPAEAKPAKKKKPFRNITQCLLHLMGTAGGKERIEACGTLQDSCDYIHEEYPDQPATPQLLKAPGAWPDEEAGGMKWRWDKKKKQRTRTVATASRMGEHFDIESFQSRPPQPSARPASPSFKCVACREPIVGADCLQVRGKLYCRECGEELQSRTIPKPR